jgi:hypothetical protein
MSQNLQNALHIKPHAADAQLAAEHIRLYAVKPFKAGGHEVQLV